MVNKFDQFVLKSVPHFIAVQYQEFLEAKTTEEKIRHALRVYELGLRVLAIGMISQYLIRDADRFKYPSLNQLLLIKLPHATLDIWQQIFFSTLKAYEGERNLFFIPELYDFFWDSSTTPPQPRPAVEVPFTRLTQIRNDLELGGIRPTNEVDWQALCIETLELLHAVLSQFAFLENYDLIRITEREGNLYWYDQYTGLQMIAGQTPLQTEHELSRGWFYLSKQNRDFLKLHPLLIFWEEPRAGSVVSSPQGDTAIYSRFLRDRLQYLIANMWGTVTDEKTVSDFVRLIYYNIEQVKQEHQQAGRITWWQLQEVAHAISERRMASVLGKYRSDLYLQRDKTKTAFEDFLASDKMCFILTGKSGMGKSNFLLSLVEEYNQKRPDICLLMYNGAKLDPKESLTTTIGQDFENYLQLVSHSDEGGIVNIWREIQCIDGIGSRKVILCIDAINENVEAKALLRQIDALVEGSPWPWLKTVVTSRSETWRTIKRRIRLAEVRYYREPGEEQLGIEMEPFSYSQELEPFTRDELPRAYEQYRQAYNLQTVYADLPAEVKLILRDPLMLYLVAKTYQGQGLPSTIKTRKVYQEYLDHLLKTERLDWEDMRFLEQELMPLMIREGHYANRITAREINEAITTNGRSLFELIHNEGKLSSGRRVNQSYINLVDAEILERYGEGWDYEIGFKYELFYDYHAGKQIYELTSTAPKRQYAYLNLARSLSSYPYLWGVVQTALQTELHVGHFSVVESLAQQEEPIINEMVVATLIAFGQEDGEAIERIIQNMYDSPHLQVRKTALMAAGRLGIQAILICAGYDREVSVRITAVRSAYFLWQEQSAAGSKILRAWANNVKGMLGLPRTKAIESCLELSILMMTDRRSKGEHLRSINESLQDIWREILASLLYINTDVGDNVISRSLRRFFLAQSINFLGRVLSGTYFRGVAQGSVLRLLADFFPMPVSRRSAFVKLMSCFNLTYEEIVGEEDLLTEVLMWNDLLSTYVVWLILILKLPHTGDHGLALVRQLFKRTLRVERPLLCSGYLAMSGWFILRREPVPISDEAFTIYRDMEQKYIDATKGLWYSNKGNLNANFGIDLFSDIEWSKCRKYRPEMLICALEKAITSENSLVFDGLLGEILRLSNVLGHPDLALEAAEALLKYDDPLIRDKLTNCLAAMRVYYPQEVEDFLDENAVSNNVRKLVRAREATEDTWTQTLTPNLAIFLHRAISQAGIREAIIHLFGEAPDCTSFEQWLRIALNEIVNMVYGKPVLWL